MKVSVWVLFLSLKLASGDKSSAATQIKKGLFVDYDPTTQPPSSSTDGVTRVQFGLTGVWLDLDKQGILRGSVWQRFRWNDERLAWTVNNDSSQPKSIYVDPSQIWTPDITLFNKFNSDSPMYPERINGHRANAVVTAKGDVIMVPSVGIQAICEDANLVYVWEEQNCTLRFGSWTHDGFEIDMDLFGKANKMDLSYYQRSSPIEARPDLNFSKYGPTLKAPFVKASHLKRVEKKYECCPEPYVSIDATLTIQRRYVQTGGGFFLNPFLLVAKHFLCPLFIMEVHLLVAIACPTLILGSLNRAEVTSQLRQGLFTNYDETTQPPSTDSDGVTQVDFGLTGFWLDLDNVGILRGSMWIKLKWNDERLSWTTNNGPDTLDHLHVDPSQIWSPDISLFNRLHAET
eukprot:maker-scaffold1347_size46067-snap-gene-0.13 protein:Tk02972 transcript:maker-scaffold1347_size46067-snap-gene-0.13-mRNA-1 annotation:"neuronal acetylcholine receptor subunit alpha-7-like"